MTRHWTTQAPTGKGKAQADGVHRAILALGDEELPEPVRSYFAKVAIHEPPGCALIREETAAFCERVMQVSPVQGQLLAFLIETIGASNVLEVGTFTGYSACWMAHALPSGGRLVTCDIDAHWTELADHFWSTAGVRSKIDLRVARGEDVMKALLVESGPGSFDMVFLDADKSAVTQYLELALQLIRVGGLIVIDNVLWGGRPADDSIGDPTTVGIRLLNERLCHDKRVGTVMLPIRDGMSLIRKRFEASRDHE